MNTFKQLLLVLLLACCALTGLGENFNCQVDSFFYEVYDGEAYMVRGDLKYHGHVVVPSSITYNDKTYPVTIIGSSAFEDCDSMTSIEIPNSIRLIQVKAFKNCTGLTSITIPSSVTYLYRFLFDGCTNLTEVNLPNTLTGIGMYAFYGCTSLKKISIPNSVKVIDNWTFLNCTGLRRITLGQSVDSIGKSAFNKCNNLANITCLAVVPPKMFDQACFSNYTATLHVPTGSLQDYQQADWWYDFSSIIGIMSHDINGDGVVSVADMTELIDYLLGQDGSEHFMDVNADINNDGRVDISDISDLIDMILIGI